MISGYRCLIYQCTARLRNPHTTLRNDPQVKGTLHLVQGDYDYYHYMQDKFDDNVRG
jgi:hypothetical protein